MILRVNGRPMVPAELDLILRRHLDFRHERDPDCVVCTLFVGCN